MKQLTAILMLSILLAGISCSGGSREGNGRKGRALHEADTGFTGIKNYLSGGIKVKEVEFRNGVREGVTRTFYKGGALENEILYSNNKRNGEARWYYPDGKLFRVTPYENDTINGSQIQYYKNGRIKARINYVNGLRVPLLEEYNINGVKVTDYPEIRYRAKDEYLERGIYKIFIEMSDMTENVKFYRGDFVNGLVDLSSCKELLQTSTTGYLDMKRTGEKGADSVTVIAAYLTPYGNKLFYRIAIHLPYKDLN